MSFHQQSVQRVSLRPIQTITAWMARPGRRGVAQMTQHDAQYRRRRAGHLLAQLDVPTREIRRQHALATAVTDQRPQYSKRNNEGDRHVQHVGPAEVGESGAKPVQRADAAAPRHPQACEHAQRPAEERVGFSGFLVFAHSRHITATARMGTGTVGERAAIRRYDD